MELPLATLEEWALYCTMQGYDPLFCVVALLYTGERYYRTMLEREVLV